MSKYSDWCVRKVKVNANLEQNHSTPDGVLEWITNPRVYFSQLICDTSGISFVTRDEVKGKKVIRIMHPTDNQNLTAELHPLVIMQDGIKRRYCASCYALIKLRKDETKEFDNRPLCVSCYKYSGCGCKERIKKVK